MQRKYSPLAVRRRSEPMARAPRPALATMHAPKSFASAATTGAAAVATRNTHRPMKLVAGTFIVWVFCVGLMLGDGKGLLPVAAQAQHAVEHVAHLARDAADRLPLVAARR